MGWREPMLILFVLGLLMGLGRCDGELNLVMPPHPVQGSDNYLCTTVELPEHGQRIVAIEPRSDQSIAHHMLLFGCGAPNPPKEGEKVWECHMRASCKSNENILYGWGKNAPKLSLPNGVGFTIGGQSGIRHLVLQVHYLNARPEEDKSGVALTLSDKASPLTASMLTYVRGFEIPPRKESHLIDNKCCITGFQEITTMAFRVHTHVMGRSVYMTRTSGFFPNGTEIARNDPQLPQGFYPVEKERRIRPGENLQVTCDFDSSQKDHVVRAGHTHDDEMCNMYMMIYSELPHFSTCMGDRNSEAIDGPGGFPTDPILLSESSISGKWKPPIAESRDSKGIKSVPGVARAANGSIWVLLRGDRVWNGDSFSMSHVFNGEPIEEDVVMELDPETGLVKQKWGKGLFYMPHMITVDYDGFIWITDAGRHQALKFNQKGELLLELGTKLEPGHDENHFCKPTQVAVLNDGRVLVADGYCNSRVMVFTKEGKLDHELKNNEMRVVHSIVADECNDSLFIADRENSKVIIYTLSKFKKVATDDIKKYGLVWALTKGPYDSILILAWKPGNPATLIAKTSRGSFAWQVPGSDDFPHDLTVGPAPTVMTGVENRLLAVYIGTTPSSGAVGGIDMYVLSSEAFKEELQALKNNEAPQKVGSGDATMDAHETIKENIRGSGTNSGDQGDSQDPGNSEESQTEALEDIPEATQQGDHPKESAHDADQQKQGVDTEVPDHDPTQMKNTDDPKELEQTTLSQQEIVNLAGGQNPEHTSENRAPDNAFQSTTEEYEVPTLFPSGAYPQSRLLFIAFISVGCLYMVFRYFRRGRIPKRNQ